MYRIILYAFFLFVYVLPMPDMALAAESANAKSTASHTERLYERLRPYVYQIKVIDKNSGEKSSIGSGFLLADSGLIATNYHVISLLVQDKTQYFAEYVDEAGGKGQLELLNIDVVHDLAILRAEGPLKGKGFTLGSSKLKKGELFYSMGNPHDLGMTIVEGNYNGLVERSLYKKILFSGAINPGMSGGPAMDSEGRIVGVNVATSGNDLGYLVPVEYLRSLVSKGKEEASWKTAITEQLKENAQAVAKDLQQGEWKSREFGRLTIPVDISPVFSCWGRGHEEKEDYHHSHSTMSCDTSDDIYIKGALSTGVVSYGFEHFQTEQLGAQAFSSFYEGRYGSISAKRNHRQVEDVSYFSCESQFIEVAGQAWKAVLCAREYKDYKGIYDSFLSAAILGERKAGHVFELWLEGFPKDAAQSLIRQFVGSIK